MAEFEEELERGGKAHERQNLLDAVFKKSLQVVLHRADVSEGRLHQQGWSSSPQPPRVKEEEETQPPYVKEEAEDPEPPHIKEEEEEPQTTHVKEEAKEGRISRQGERHERLEVSPAIGVHVKSEDDEDKGQSGEKREEAEPPSSPSTEAGGGSQADVLPASQSDSDETISVSPETDDEDWKADVTSHADSTACKRSVCGKRFSGKGYLTAHTGEKPFPCSACGEGFAQNDELKTHTRKHTGGKPFACSLCGKRFSLKRNLKRHSATHTREKPFTCSACGQRFSHRKDLQMHTKMHNTKPFTCSVCGLRYTRNQCLKKHMRIHIGEKPFPCPMSVIGLAGTEELKIHTKRPSGMKLYSCSICNRSSYDRATLVRHMRRHADISEEHLLPEQKEWRSKAEQEEANTPHIEDEDVEPQPPCIKEEAKEGRISQQGERHERPAIGVHVKSKVDEDKGWSGEKREEAEPPSSPSIQHITEADGGAQADRLLASLPDKYDAISVSPDTDDEDSKADVTSHPDNTRWKCSQCGRTLSNKSNLVAHMKTHTGEKPFMCSICGNSFSRKASLTVHTRIHSGEKPYTCSVCGGGFRRTYDLKVHLRIHAGEKPFKCSVCGKSMTRKYDMKVHEKTHWGKSLYLLSVW